MATTASGRNTVRLHRLTMVAEDDGIMVGRPETGSYAVFPEEGAQALRMLGAGTPVSTMAEWYQQACGEQLDVEDFLGTIEELGFVRAEGEEEPAGTPVRWQRLGRWAFSWPAWLCYLALTAAALAAMVRRPSLRPSYHDVFFTDHLVLIPVVLTATQIPCVLLHEGYHALSGRRLGLPSTLSIGRRLYYLVAETRLDSLYSVPRNRRYLPFCAGILADVLQVSAFTLLSAALHGRGIPPWCPALCLAVSFSCVIRIVWQFMFYLRTDLYFVMTNALRCSDLDVVTRFQLRTFFLRLLRRTPPEPDAEWSDRDRAMARVYAPVMVAGYGFSLGSLLWAGLPTTLHFCTLIANRFTGPHTSLGALLDAASFLGLTLLEFGLVGYVALRDRRAGRTTTQGAPS
ncbi:hypothetical protein [Streptacidiphilus albus]|uniref:hypothetical protein n=1 Tax=Streptacidiphilus albus TaxID=105425 RepID=UPI00054B8B96|nr:hypothetical protein [Streptacidiphilus albus]